MTVWAWRGVLPGREIIFPSARCRLGGTGGWRHTDSGLTRFPFLLPRAPGLPPPHGSSQPPPPWGGYPPPRDKSRGTASTPLPPFPPGPTLPPPRRHNVWTRLRFPGQRTVPVPRAGGRAGGRAGRPRPSPTGP
ncbi:hypothetical protein Naga_101018g1 [Nannochloropsis gaditana]|uniref:Uncharacterized protein n=1 Tax=Nannochloropsis gaditana TaxID=72520 RepID=W7TMN4_9STRA|nr:hypothetical protein Naga_101018g1 [Nannochloropsis gaditana]